MWRGEMSGKMLSQQKTATLQTLRASHMPQEFFLQIFLQIQLKLLENYKTQINVQPHWLSAYAKKFIRRVRRSAYIINSIPTRGQTNTDNPAEYG